MMALVKISVSFYFPVIKFQQQQQNTLLLKELFYEALAMQWVKKSLTAEGIVGYVGTTYYKA